jgi:hypothetical protein
MEWANRVELAYRVFVRTTQDVDFQFQEMRRVLQTAFPGRCEFAYLEDLHLPVRPEQVAGFQAKGYLVTEAAATGERAVVIRELPVQIRGVKLEPSKQTADRVLSLCGNVFAVVRIVAEALTEVVAV